MNVLPVPRTQIVQRKESEQMKAEDLTVELRLVDYEKTKAFADVTIPLGNEGDIKISGWSVLDSGGKAPLAAPPARKGNSRYFDVVSLTGRIRSVVEEVILKEYQRQKKANK